MSRTVRILLLVIVILGLCLCNAWRDRKVQARHIAQLQAYIIELEKLPTIFDIQRRIGCEKIDGKLCDQWYDPNHSETQNKWGIATGNEISEKFYTKSGGPE